MTKTCFIIEELYPQDLGGIGRLMHNIIRHSHETHPDSDLHIVLCNQAVDKSQILIDTFKGIAALHYLDSDQNIADRLGLVSLENAASTRNLKTPFLKGLRILDAVLQAEKSIGDVFDHIEIPDHMGLGAVILSAKKAGIAFQKTEITCRIHSSLSAIIDHEPFYHERNDWLAPRLEMERQSLRDADRIVAHLPAIADYNKTHFDLPGSWLEKVEIAFPPVIWPHENSSISKTDKNADFVFTSRFQPFKRPELFIKAAITMLESGTDYSGNFRLISYGFDRDYVDDLRLMIPQKFRGRIRIETNLPAADRQTAITHGIIVQPSGFESLCALAYEVSTAGRPILLARDCLAFGETARWVDRENCIMFDPTAQRLAAAMETARQWKPTSIVDTTPDPNYFHDNPDMPPLQDVSAKTSVLIGPLITKQDFETFAEFDLADIVVKGFASSENIGRFAKDSPANILAFSPADYQGTQLRQFTTHTHGCVVIASPNALPSPDFISTGLGCIRKGSVFTSNSKTISGTLNIYPGKMPTILASDYRLSPLCFMFHPDDLCVISETDDRDILQQLQCRIADSDLDVILCPYPLIVETNPLTDHPPDRRILGFSSNSSWQNGVRRIGVDVKSAAFSEFLTSRPAGISDFDKDVPYEITVHADKPHPIQLRTKAALSGLILTVKVNNLGHDGVASVSIHQSSLDHALELHSDGKHIRKIRGKQAYQMRWGPLLLAEPLVLVISATHETKLQIDEFFLISRE